MKHGRRLLCGLILGLVLPMPGARGGELAEPAWREARKEAKSLMKTPGYRFRKEEYVAQVSRDNSRRAAELLVQWYVRSGKYQSGKLQKELDKAQKAYDKAYERRERDKDKFKKCREALEKAIKHREAETFTQFHIGQGLAAISNIEAIRYLIDAGLPALQKQKGTDALQVIVARSVLRQSKDLVKDTALALAKDGTRPKLQILGVNWIGMNQYREGWDALLTALAKPPVAVQRAAVFALKTLDDRKAVKPLIDAMQGASGLLNDEIDHLLHHFTGKSFEGSASVWKRWWGQEGEAWLAKPPPPRKPKTKLKKEQKKGATMVRFYGIPTPSHHVVFVVDRSHSMSEPASAKSKAKKAEQPKGPVTGGEKGKTQGGEVIAGDTKMEVAKNQLAKSIDELDSDVRFAVLFYSNDVKVWQEPPELMPSSPQNKQKAKEWVKTIQPVGPTLTFGALMKALEYADTIGERKKKGPLATGADTIFLLSDGSPTTADARVLEGEELEHAFQAFMQENELYHCVVHTIGIGPGHNSRVLKRIARETGGTYKAVGKE